MLYFKMNPFLCLSTSINVGNHNFNRCYNGGPAIYVFPGEADVSQHLGIYHIKKFLSVQSKLDQSVKLHQAPVGHSTSFYLNPRNLANVVSKYQPWMEQIHRIHQIQLIFRLRMHCLEMRPWLESNDGASCFEFRIRRTYKLCVFVSSHWLIQHLGIWESYWVYFGENTLVFI